MKRHFVTEEDFADFTKTIEMASASVQEGNFMHRKIMSATFYLNEALPTFTVEFRRQTTRHTTLAAAIAAYNEIVCG